jgi:putative acetyltransferase
MFYLKNGFSIIGEELTDDAGRPYPILHLKL